MALAGNTVLPFSLRKTPQTDVTSQRDFYLISVIDLESSNTVKQKRGLMPTKSPMFVSTGYLDALQPDGLVYLKSRFTFSALALIDSVGDPCGISSVFLRVLKRPH